MKRRSFIKLSSLASVTALMPHEVFAFFQKNNIDPCDISNRKIVLIELNGGNDGLNTVVPINQYDLYAQLRANIKLDFAGLNGIITLDNTLALEDQVGLHPNLTGFKELYDQGKMRLIQGVGYPSQNRSHFKSMDLWQTGGDGKPENYVFQSGWMGRYMETFYSQLLDQSYPLAIQLGAMSTSLGFQGLQMSNLALNITGQNPAGFYNVVNGISGPAPTQIPNSEYGDLLQFIIDNQADTNLYADAVTTAFDTGSNQVEYPNLNLCNQLKTVARLISGDLGTKVYLVRLNGFDTHSNQVPEDEGTPHLGNHANLMNQLSEGVKLFFQDLNAQGRGDDVIAVTYSEFGRKIAENGSFGTDHGSVNPMFVFGNGVEAGISGTNINLSKATEANNFQIETVQHDYRRMFATVLQDWLGASTQTLDYTFWDYHNNIGFSETKIPYINGQHLVDPDCYTDALVSLDENSKINLAHLYPNPAHQQVFVSVDQSQITSITITDLSGKIVKKHIPKYSEHTISMDVSDLANGQYVVNIDATDRRYVKMLQVIH